MSVETPPPSSSHAIVRIPVRLRRLTLNYCLHRHIAVAASASILHHAFSIYTIIARYQGPVRIFVVVIVGTTPSCSSHFALFQQFHSTALCMTWKILLPDSCITIPRSRPSGIWQQCVLQLCPFTESTYQWGNTPSCAVIWVQSTEQARQLPRILTVISQGISIVHYTSMKYSNAARPRSLCIQRGEMIYKILHDRLGSVVPCAFCH